MTVSVDVWQLIGFGLALLSGFATIIVAAGKTIASQFERRINERFDVIERAREAEAAGISHLEREFMHWKAELPVQYVRRENVLRRRADAAERTADGLRGTIARLDTESRARRAEGTCAAAEREADAAATARELLSTCAGRYTAMAAEAGGLANQVMGLQDHVVVVQPEAAALLRQGDE